MKKVVIYVSSILLAAALMVGAYFLGSLRQVQKYEDSLKDQKDSLENVISQREIELQKFESVKDSLQLRVDELSEMLDSSKKDYDKKVVVVSGYSNPELEQFFSDRYGS